MNYKYISMQFSTYFKKVAPAMVIFVVMLTVLNLGSYDPYNELTVLNPDNALAALTGAQLAGAELTKTELEGAELDQSTELERAELDESAELKGAELDGAELEETELDKSAELDGAELDKNVTTTGNYVHKSCEISANSNVVYTGTNVTITWETEGYSTVTLNGVTMADKSGSKTFTNIQNNTTYTLRATNADGKYPCASTVTITCVPPPAVLSCRDLGYDITAAKFEWNGTLWVKKTEHADFDVTVSGNSEAAHWYSNHPIAKVIAYAGTAYKTYNPGGDGRIGVVKKCEIGNGCHGISTIQLCANPPPVEPAPTCTLTPASKTVNVGESVNLAWTTTNAASATLTDFGTVALPSGTQNTGAIVADKTYTLNVVGTNGDTIQCRSNIKVEEPDVDPLPKCDSFTASPTTITRGESATLTWATTNTTGVTIDNEIGQRDSDGTYTVTPLADTTYILTAQGTNGQKDTCPVTVQVEEPHVDPVPRCDSFGIAPTTITRGKSALLTWTTTNASKVIIDNGVGEQLPDGTYTVTPLANTTYTLTAHGVNNQQKTCTATIKVEEPHVDPVPKCVAFTATPTTLPIGGGKVEFKWTTLDATSVSISPTIGDVTGANGSTTLNVTENKTFTLTVANADGSKKDTCTVNVTVTPSDPTPISCAANVNINANPTSIRRGNDSTITWSTSGITALSFDNGISATGLNGSVTVSPNSDTTYTLTATDGKDTIKCPVSIDVSSGGGGGGSSSPRCELSISDSKISVGEEVTLTWDSTRARDIILEDETADIELISTEDMSSREKERFFEGKVRVSPKEDTTYVLTVKRGSSTRKCEVDVEVEDNVSVTQVRDQQPLVAGIALAQVPYTGFEAGPILTLMFYVLLMAWALYIAYLLVIRRDAIGGLALANNNPTPVVPNKAAMATPHVTRTDMFVEQVRAPEVATNSMLPNNLPTGAAVIGYANAAVSQGASEVSTNNHNIDNVEMTNLENHAHAQKTLLSSDAIRHLINNTSNDEKERTEVLDQVIKAAKAQFPAEDGWVVVNEKRMQELCKVNATDKTDVKQESSYIPTVVPEGAGSLAEAIVTGNVIASYEMIGHRPMFALADAAADLDAVYRIRRGGEATASELLMRETANLSDEQLLKVIEALTGALDGTYTDEASAVKMSIMKAIKVVA